VRWSAGAVPPLPDADAAWRLSLDVAPVLEPGETEDVVGDVFCAAANAGLFVHTLEGRRVLFDVTPAEAQRRCKRIPLLPRRTYHVALVRPYSALIEPLWVRSPNGRGFLPLSFRLGFWRAMGWWRRRGPRRAATRAWAS
jgi:hypothetical protein